MKTLLIALLLLSTTALGQEVQLFSSGGIEIHPSDKVRYCVINQTTNIAKCWTPLDSVVKDNATVFNSFVEEFDIKRFPLGD